MYYKLGSIWYQINLMSLLFLKLLSVLHFEFKVLRYEALKMGSDFLGILYVDHWSPYGKRSTEFVIFCHA